MTSVPIAARRSLRSGACMVFTNSALRRVMIGRGVPAGAMMPYQVVTSKFGRPASSAVGTSGSSGERSRAGTASARSLPALMGGARCGFRADIAARAAAVLRHHRLAEARRQPLGEQASEDVGATARREGQDEAQRARRIAVLRLSVAGEEGTGEKQCSHAITFR